MAETSDRTDTDPGPDLQARVVELLSAPREVTARDVDVLRTRLELLHDMADGDREERERHRAALKAALAEMEQRMRDLRRDHRSIRQTLGDLAALVNRHSADGSTVRAGLDEVRAAVLEARHDAREAVQHLQRDTRRSIEQIEAHVRADRDWIGATQAHVDRLGGDLARQDGDAVGLREMVARHDRDLARQRDAELEHASLLREQLAEATAAIAELRAESKRQAALITRLRADLKQAAPPPPAARKATAKKAAATKAAAKAPTKRTSRAKPDSVA